ncbi:hypothetical protein OS493_021646 [Desmophyllum pertusum]|uniref:Coiled-coil domain-containing protein 167 n=1 Tax=Desmophyllum pertusum TaxID=174260 RepID=A0A9W9YCQ5_9CNID|nr:hypothetical protein OS493_021646 [Desmophyllum pertusum]
MTTIVSQIEDVEHNIRGCEDELDVIDRSLRLKKISDGERDELVTKQNQLKEEIKEHEIYLGTLRKENRKSMAVSVAILALLVLGYLLICS